MTGRGIYLDDILVDSPFVSKFRLLDLMEHPDNNCCIWLTLYKLGFIPMDHRYCYAINQRQQYSIKYMTSDLRKLYE